MHWRGHAVGVSNSVISGTDVRLHGGNSVIQLHGYLARVVPDGAWLRSLDRTRGESSAVNGAGGRIAALGAARNILRVRGGGRGGAHITATSDDGGSSGSSGGQRIRTMGKHDVKAGHTSALYGISVAIAYAATSVAITFANKIVLSSYDFKFEMTLILAQLVLGTLVINLLFAFGVCERPPLKIDTLRKSVPLAGWFLVYVVSGLGSLRSLTMPTWSALRRLTALFILVFDFGFDGKVAPLRIWLSVLMMLLGGVVAAAGDFDGSLRGHVHVAINCASSALYLRAINALRSSAGVSEVGALYLTNLLCFTPVVSIIYLTNEGSKVVAFPEWGQTGFLIALFGSSALAGLLNYLVFLSAAVNSPLTTSITGQAKNVVGSLGGYLLLPHSAGGGVGPAQVMNVSGCLIGLCASMWYAVLKFRERFPVRVV